jgi:hypothetical protein
MEPVLCPEMLVTKYQFTLRKISERRKSKDEANIEFMKVLDACVQL